MFSCFKASRLILMILAFNLPLSFTLGLGWSQSQKAPQNQNQNQNQNQKPSQKPSQNQSQKPTQQIQHKTDKMHFESESYRFQIHLPSSAWTLLTPQQAQKISPLALGGALAGDRVLGVVMAEPHRNLDLESYAQALMDYSPLSEIVVEQVAEIQKQGLTALRIQYSGDLQSGRFRYITDLFFREDQAFQVTAGGLISQVKNQDLMAFLKSMTLTEGALNLKKAQPKRVEDQWGVGWLFQDQVFSSFLSGLRIPTPKTWQALVGKKLMPLNGDADFGLHRVDLNLHLLFFHTACPEPDESKCRSWLTHDLVEGFGLEKQAQTYEFKVAGQPVSFQSYRNSQGVFQYLHGIYIHEKQATHLLAWTLDQQNQNADAQAVPSHPVDYTPQWMEIQKVLRTTTALSSAQKAELRAEYFRAQNQRFEPSSTLPPSLSSASSVPSVSSTPSSSSSSTSLPPSQKVQSFFGSNFTFRRNESWIKGIYHNHLFRLKWKQPSGIWNVALSDSHDQSSLSLHAPLHSLNAQLSWLHQPHASLKAVHQKSLNLLLQDLELTPQQLIQKGGKFITKKSSFAGHLSQVSTLTLPHPYSLTYRLHTTQFKSTFVHLLSWSPSPLDPQGVLENIEAGLSFTHRSPIQLKAHRYEDQRFYFALDLMKEGTLELNPDLGLGTWSTAVTYESDDVLVMGFAVGQTQAKGFKRFARHLAQRILPNRSTPPKVTQSSDVWIQGYPAKKYKWVSPSPVAKDQDLVIYLVSRDPLLYGYLIYAKAEHSQFKKGGKALSLLEVE